MPNATIINKFGTLQGWNSITVNLLGRDVEGITAVKYNDSQTKENAYGAGPNPIGRGKGNYEPEASITLYKEEIDGIQKVLPPGSRLQDVPPFDIQVVYEKEDGQIQKDRIMNCEFTDNGRDVKQNDGTIATELKLITSHILWNV